MRSVNSRWLPIAGLLTAMMLWASSFIALKLAFKGYDPMVVIFGRMAVATVCAAFFLKRLRPRAFAFKDLKYLLFMAFCEPCLYFLFEAKALVNTTASQAGMITAMLPLMVAIGARIFLGEHISSRTLTGFILAIVGGCWLSVSGHSAPDAPNPILGNFLEFLAMVCATGYILTLKRLTRSYSPAFLTVAQAVVGTVFFFPLLFLPSTRLPTEFLPLPAGAILYLGLFVTLGAYGLYNFGVSKIPASEASAFVNLIPVFTVFLGWIILGERFTFPQYLASGLIFAGIFMTQSGNTRSTTKANPVPTP